MPAGGAGRERRFRRVLPMRVLLPNAVTALALCSGLTGVRFAIGGEWEKAGLAVLVSAVLDGLDGRIARLLRGESRFGAELDSLSDVIAFGVSPAIIIYLWSLQYMPGVGWTFALAHAVCCALRLARFNANLDVENQPHKRAGFLTGVPAPAGAGLALMPLYFWLWTKWPPLANPAVTATVLAATSFLMVSDLPTFSWKSIRLPSSKRMAALVAVALLGGALISAPFAALSIVASAYAALIPLSIRSYGKVKRQREGLAPFVQQQPGGDVQEDV